MSSQEHKNNRQMSNSPEPVVPLAESHPYQRLLTYPDDDSQQQAHYRQQLRQLGVECLLAAGPERLIGLPLLGIGYCGVVLAGIWQGHAVAIKLRRRSCQQPDLSEEARLLRQANLLNIGPQLYCHQGDILVMERLSGQPFAQWLAHLSATEAPLLSRMLRRLLWQGFHLDQAGLDHGALRCVDEHVIITGEHLTVIDFSHSSTNRRPNNVTSLISGLLWGTRLAQDLRRLLQLPERGALLPWLQQYKHHQERGHFQALLRALGLDEEKI